MLEVLLINGYPVKVMGRIREYITKKHEGIFFTIANNEVEAIKELQSKEFDLVVTELFIRPVGGGIISVDVIPEKVGEMIISLLRFNAIEGLKTKEDVPIIVYSTMAGLNKDLIKRVRDMKNPPVAFIETPSGLFEIEKAILDALKQTVS